MEDKIFQFYYKKIYGQKSNYLSFKTFSDKNKVSFLINLYLFISNINSNNNFDNIDLFEKSKEKTEAKNFKENENDPFYTENYNKIMNDFQNILNRTKTKSNENNFNKTNNNSFVDAEKHRNNELFLTKHKFNKKYEEIKKKLWNSSYIKYNYNYESNKKENNNEDNYFEEKNNSKENIIKSKKNDIDITINKPLLKPSSSLCVISISSKRDKLNALNSTKNNEKLNEEYKFIGNDNIYNNNLVDKMENNNINSISERENNLHDKLLLFKSCPISNENESLINRDDKALENLILINQTMTEKSRINLEEFKNDNIVEKLIKCPQNKYISLDCNEANKLALVIINLMETKNELENEIQKERKKNEIRLNRLKLDYNREKREIKSNYSKREINLLDTLNLLKKEIDDEKQFLSDNFKSYNLWDKVSIENQKTKQIRNNIIKKLESIKNEK